MVSQRISMKVTIPNGRCMRYHLALSSLTKLQRTLNELRENNGTITRTEETFTPVEDVRTRALQSQHSSSTNRKRPASPVSLADINLRSRQGSLKKRVMHSDVYGTNDEYPQTPTLQSEHHDASPSERASSPTLSIEGRVPASYASPLNLALDDAIMDDSFPAIDATNEDGMLS